MGRLGWMLGWVAIAGCEGPWATGPLPQFQQAPVILRFEIFPAPQTPTRGPFALEAAASGQGPLTFTWGATGGILSVASTSATASTPLTPAFTAWQPPSRLGTYDVILTVQNPAGASTSRTARFAVEAHGTRILAPIPWQVPPPHL